MATGFYLAQEDKTSCAGSITGGTEDHQLPGNAAARVRRILFRQ